MSRAAGLIGMISGLCGALIGVYAVMDAVYAMLGYSAVRFRGTDLDADWRTAGALAAVSLVFLGLAWLMNRVSRR